MNSKSSNSSDSPKKDLSKPTSTNPPSSSTTTNTSTPSTGLPGLGILEEDDEFEDFPVEDWDDKIQDHDDVHTWEDNWDDDDVNDEFTNQLRAEFKKLQQSGQTVMNTMDSMQTH